MRMPNSRQISDEQEEIYIEAPTDGSIIVIGPPGTGKTVIAFLRAQTLKRKNQQVTVVMYNRVLQRYTNNIGDIESSTLHRWLYSWWKKNGIVTASNSNNVYINCPFSEKDDAKSCGAKWDKAKKKWYVPKAVFDTEPEKFERWPQECVLVEEDLKPPKVSEWVFDWNAMLVAVAQKQLQNDWGHLIIDEAQDFPKEMYGFLRFSSTQLKRGGLTILADENQRLNEDSNSTIEQIIQSLSIPNERYYTLKENYRNTYQIAILANNFYVGLSSGSPKLPSRQGDLPQLVKTSSQDDQVNFIVRVLSTRVPGEVGVFLENNNQRQSFFEKLNQKLGNQYRVQSYSSGQSHMVDDMVFDEEGTLTVLNRQSCKGLEFDFVFLPELQSINIDGSHLDTFKMNMYVMCSRARESLFLMYSSSGEKIEFLEYLPNSEANILEYKDVSK